MSFHNHTTIATLPRTQRGMPLVLGGDPKGKNFLYANGNSIIIRDINDPRISDIYTEHSVQTTVAKYSPSGFYICSADISGKVRIWDTTQKEHILKNEYQPFAGTIKDLAWSNDNQRICVVGEGRERFGHVFMVETGTSVGEISGISNIINSVDFRPKRPFRIITGSEDNSIGIFEGPPFKFKDTLNDHTRFVQSVRFSPNGDLFASGGFDGKMFLYKADDYSKVGEFGSPAHGGGVYAVAWSPDGTKVLSASGDKTCKLWDASTQELITEFPMGNDILDQQVSCLWQDQHLLSVSLSGFINYLDMNNPNKPLRIIKFGGRGGTELFSKHSKLPQLGEIPTIAFKLCNDFLFLIAGNHTIAIELCNFGGRGGTELFSKHSKLPQLGEIPTIAFKLCNDFLFLIAGNHTIAIELCNGHNKSITALTVSPDKKTIFTGSHDAAIMYWDVSSNDHDRIKGVGHSNQVQNMAVSSDYIYTCSLDDTMKVISAADREYRTETVKFDSQPRDLTCISGDTVLVAEISQLSVVRNGKVISTYPIDFDGQCISAHPQEQDIAVGGGDKKVHIFLLNGCNFSPKMSLEHSGAITDVAYSPDGKYLAACDSNRKVVLYDALTYELSSNQDWCFHTARVNCLAWNPNSLYLATGSLDTNIIIWNVQSPTKHFTMKHAHPQSQITRLAWLDNNTLVSTGHDSNIKIWNITF